MVFLPYHISETYNDPKIHHYVPTSYISLQLLTCLEPVALKGLLRHCCELCENPMLVFQLSILRSPPPKICGRFEMPASFN